MNNTCSDSDVDIYLEFFNNCTITKNTCSSYNGDGGDEGFIPGFEIVAFLMALNIALITFTRYRIS